MRLAAKINSLDSRTGFLDAKPPGLAVTLAFTATANGKLCASLIEKELKSRYLHETFRVAVELP